MLLVNVRPFSRWTAPGTKYFFAVAITSPSDGSAQVSCRFYGGVRPTPSGRAKLMKSETPRVVLMEVPSEELRAVLFDPSVQGDELLLRDAQIVDVYHQVIHRFSAADASPSVPDTMEVAADGTLKLKLVRGASIMFTPSAPVTLARNLWPGWGVVLAEFLGSGILFALLCKLLARRFPGAFARATSALAAWAVSRPKTAVFLAALAAVLVSCHPVIFLGRSFVSPNNGVQALYEAFPSLPGSTDVEVEDSAGTDLGAAMWASIPYSVMEREALAHGEWPLRNRYAYNGLGLQGQGISMFGDPLHFIPIAANGAAWAWDLKFLIAKLLFAFGAGLLVRAAVNRVGVAVLVAASAPFIGFFAYRFNHPAFFAMCHAPWILLAWLRAAVCVPRALWKWMLLLIVASLAEFNCGVIKEPVCILIMLNFAGLLVVLLRGNRAAALAMIWANVLFVLIAAPFWLTFLDLLGHAYTVYDQAKVFQIHPRLFAGLFDDLFYRQTQPREQHFNPSANFLLLLGVLWSLVRWRTLLKEPAWLACLLAAVPALAIVFGVVPPAWIAAIPFIGKIWHVDNCFSLPVIVLTFVLAAFGLRECLDRRRDPGWRFDWVVFAVLLGGSYAIYFGFRHTAPRTGLLFTAAGGAVSMSTFFFAYCAGLAGSVLLLPWLWRRLTFGRLGVAGWVVMLLAFGALHFRHSMFAGTKFDAYVMNPQPRPDFHALSPAVEAIRRRIEGSHEPARVLGLSGNLAPDFNAVYGLETPFGCDAVLNRWQWELADAAGFMRLWGWRIVVMKQHFPALQPMLDFFNVRYIVTMPTDDKRPIPGLTPIGERDMVVHESRTTWPRAFFTDRIARYSGASEMVKLVNASEAKPLAAFENTEPTPPSLAGIGDELTTRTVVSATQYALTPNTTAFHITAPARGVVVLGEAFETGNYRVTVNGASAEPLRMNHGFLGVAVPAAGEYEVRFTYRPHLWSLALGIASAGIFLLVLTALLAKKFVQQGKQ